MSIVVAGAVALGLTQLGVPVASAASSSTVSWTVSTAKTRLDSADVLASQAMARESLTGAAPTRSEAVAAPDIFDSYDLSFRIGRIPLTPAQFFVRVRRDFVGVFPIPGAKPLNLGVNMDLRPLKPALFNVRVATLVSNGWTFSTRPGHPEFPNGYISFRFNKIGADMYLMVHGFIPHLTVAGRCMLDIVCHNVYMSHAASTWSRFSVNLARLWQVAGGGGGGGGGGSF